MDIAVLTGGAVQWRFIPHSFDGDENTLVTPRTLHLPPVPVGAELLLDGKPLGKVISVVPAQMRRWEIAFERPPAHDELALLGLDEATTAVLHKAAMTILDLYRLNEEDLQHIAGIGARRARDIRSAMDQYAVAVDTDDHIL